MTVFRPSCLPTAVGSMPHADPAEACDLVLRYLPELPVWPQLPRRSPLESMYVQYFEHFPGAVFDGGKICVDGPDAVEAGLERLYADYLEGSAAGYGLDPAWAAGLAEMRRRWAGLPKRPYAVKGQVTGPISAGLQIVDRRLRPVLYDEVLADALAKYLRLVAREQERVLHEAAERTIVVVDEPYLTAVGSAFIPISADQVTQLLGEVLGGIDGLKGLHCCGNTDWSLVLSLPLDVVSFDAFGYADTLALYPADVKAFLARGGVLAWGIVPNDQDALEGETAESLTAHLMTVVEQLATKGIDRDDLLAASLITPSCGLGPTSPAGAERALALTMEVAARIRRDFVPGVS